MPLSSTLSEILSCIESSRGAAALAENKLWQILHTKSENISSHEAHDLAVIAGNLSATGLQFRAHLEILRSFVNGR